MPTRKAVALWEGTIKEGHGTMSFGGLKVPYSFVSRFGDGAGTNPEELIAAAHAGCFSMALSLFLEKAGYKPESVHTTARVSIEKSADGFRITSSELDTEADVPGLDEEKFREQAEAAKAECPVSRALAGVEIKLKARLLARVA